MAEWTIAAVLKTVVAKATVGSNPTPTARLGVRYQILTVGDVGNFFYRRGARAGRIGLPAKQLRG